MIQRLGYLLEQVDASALCRATCEVGAKARDARGTFACTEIHDRRTA